MERRSHCKSEVLVRYGCTFSVLGLSSLGREPTLLLPLPASGPAAGRRIRLPGSGKLTANSLPEPSEIEEELVYVSLVSWEGEATRTMSFVAFLARKSSIVS